MGRAAHAGSDALVSRHHDISFRSSFLYWGVRGILSCQRTGSRGAANVRRDQAAADVGRLDTHRAIRIHVFAALPRAAVRRDGCGPARVQIVAATAVQPGEAAGEVKKDRKPVSPKALARLFPRVKPYLGHIALATVCLLAASAAGLAFPAIVAVLLDTAFQHGNSRLLNEITLGLLLLFAVQASLNMVQVYLLTATAERVIAKLRTDLFGHLVHLSPGFFTDRRTGELTSRLGSDTSVLQTVLSTNLSEFTRQSIFLIGALVMLTIKQPALTGTTLAVAPLVVGAAFLFGRMLRRASTGVQDRIAEATGTADEAFAQIRMVQSFTAEKEESRKYDLHLFDVVRAAVARAKIRGVFFGALTFFGFSGVVVVLWEGGRLVLAGELTAGALVSFLLYAMYVAGAIASLASLFGAYQEATGAAQRI